MVSSLYKYISRVDKLRTRSCWISWIQNIFFAMLSLGVLKLFPFVQQNQYLQCTSLLPSCRFLNCWIMYVYIPLGFYSSNFSLVNNFLLYSSCWTMHVISEGSTVVLFFQAIFTAGYKAVLHIHSIVEECEIIELLQQIDPKTKKPMKKKVLFVKNGAVVVCRIQVCFFIYSNFSLFLYNHVNFACINIFNMYLEC